MQFRERLSGAWPSVAAPTPLWLLVVASEEWSFPGVIAAVLAAALYFGSFAYLVKIQFARRQQYSDVASSFVLAEVLGFMSLAAVMMVLWLR